jgi:hypothetical protein
VLVLDQDGAPINNGLKLTTIKAKESYGSIQRSTESPNPPAIVEPEPTFTGTGHLTMGMKIAEAGISEYLSQNHCSQVVWDGNAMQPPL